MKLYSVRDVLSGFYPPVCLSNDRLALRYFTSGAFYPDNVPVTDIELYCLGEFNNENGVIESKIPEFLASGKEIKKNENVQDKV